MNRQQSMSVHLVWLLVHVCALFNSMQAATDTQVGNMTKGITSIANQFDGILLDAYGVFWGGNECGLFPGAQDAMEKLVRMGKVVGIISNSTQLAKKEIEKYAKHGVVQGVHFHFLLTSGEEARGCLMQKQLPFDTPRNTFWVFGSQHPKFSSHTLLFQDTIYQEVAHIEEADFIFIAIPHIHGEDQTSVAPFYEEIRKIRIHNLPMLCANPDTYAHEGRPARAVVRQGSIAATYEELGGTVFYIGKPHRRMYESAMLQLQKYGVTEASRVLMVGDNPETDIRGANRYKIPSALIFQTGVMADLIRKEGFAHACETLSDIPEYYVERFVDDL